MAGNRQSARIFPYKRDLYHLAPIPLIMREIQVEDQLTWHAELVKDAQANFSQKELDLPDVKHIYDMGDPPDFKEDQWTEKQIPAIGVWHRVPTNNYLSINTPAVCRLRTLIEEHYMQGLEASGEIRPDKAYISESWIQFYQNGDYKVLHNHERYGPPYLSHSWSGGYYINDGAPDPTMPYSGMLSFCVRNENHFIRPRAGLLLLWPSDILHEVHPYYGSGERIVVNFNINSSFS